MLKMLVCLIKGKGIREKKLQKRDKQMKDTNDSGMNGKKKRRMQRLKLFEDWKQ